MSACPNLIYRFNAIPNKIPVSYAVDIHKPILKFSQRSKTPRIVSTKSKKNQVGSLTLPDVKTYYKATVIKSVALTTG